MWWILNSSLLAGARRGVPILVLAVCGCLFFFYTPLPTLVWDLQHSRLNNWHTKINPLTTALPGPRKRCTGIKILQSRMQPQSPCLLVCLICNSATKDDSSCPLWSRALLTLREKQTDRDRERQRERETLVSNTLLRAVPWGALGPLNCLAPTAYNEGIINFSFRGWKIRMWTLYGYTICAVDIYWFIPSSHLSLTLCSHRGHSLLFSGIPPQCNLQPRILSMLLCTSKENWGQSVCIPSSPR